MKLLDYIRLRFLGRVLTQPCPYCGGHRFIYWSRCERRIVADCPECGW